MIRLNVINKLYAKKAKKLIKKEAKTPKEANDLKEVCRVMGNYHFVRYKMGKAKDGVDFLDAKKHNGETWSYDYRNQKFVKIS